MFDSGISVKNLIEELKNTEVDIALDIPNITYVTWLNALQQLLYTEVIKEQKKTTLAGIVNNPIDLSDIHDESMENRPRFEDVHAVYARIGDDDVQLIKSTVASGVIFPNTYFRITDKLAFHTESDPGTLTIVYFTKPKLVTVGADGTIDDSNVMVPVEFIDLVKAKLRGEAYKLANEDAIAGKWLNDYNILLETFKVWVSGKAPNFGL